ncbi:MAG TPA: arsenosugar biosynthesis radical SAM (seleno)protein ArsS [Gammaproteobacteria bacterium]
MHAMLPLLQHTDFPQIRRGRLETLQVNLGYKCNQSCFHCHVNAGPNRTEMMSRETLDTVLTFLETAQIDTLDITGGAPELHPDFRELVVQARQSGVRVMDRCNLTVLNQPGQEGTAAFLAEHQVEIVASLPCYLENNVNAQRGDGVFQSSLVALHKLNELGYGTAGSGLLLNLVYNPVGAHLPPAQEQLETDYKRELKTRYNVEFNNLFTITNMPIARFGSTLVSKGGFEEYMQLLKSAYRKENLHNVMCRSLISVDYQGYVYDCDFNQMLKIPFGGKRGKTHLRDLMNTDLKNQPIAIADHCYGCTAGQGSSCGGALG